MPLSSAPGQNPGGSTPDSEALAEVSPAEISAAAAEAAEVAVGQRLADLS